MSKRRSEHRPDSDRRSSVRIPEEFAVRTTTEAGEVAIASAGELSENGLFVQYILPYEHGTVVHVEFELPGLDPIAVQAEVASVETFLPSDLSRTKGNGLRFVDLAPHHHAAIRAFIDRSLS